MDEDFANNNDHHRRTRDDDIEEDMDAEHDTTKDEKDSEDEKLGPSSIGKMPFPASFLSGLTPGMPGIPSSIGNSSPSPFGHPNANVVTDQLKNISMTISQLTSNLANTSSPKSVQELAVLQATLFSLQQQQLLHMQILGQMQQAQQDNTNSSTSDNEKQQNSFSGQGLPNSIAELAKKMELQNSLEPPTKPIMPVSFLGGKDTGDTNSSTKSHSRRDSTLTADSTPIPPSLPPKVSLASNMLTGNDFKPVTSSPASASRVSANTVTNTSGNSTNTSTTTESNLPLSSQILDPNAPPSLASSIIMHPEGSTEDKPVNSLELLQVNIFHNMIYFSLFDKHLMPDFSYKNLNVYALNRQREIVV